MVIRLLSALILLLLSATLPAQQNKKPEKIYIVNDSLVNIDVINGYVKDGSVKEMRMGVSDGERARLTRIHGDKIGDNFIMVISLKTEAEKATSTVKTTVKAPTEDPSLHSYKLNIGDYAKDFTVQMLDGNSIHLSELKRQVVLLNFWATWCVPCMMEFYEMPEQILKRFEKEKLMFIPISRGETKSVVAKKMKQLNEKGVNFNVGLDPDKKIWDNYATAYIPKNFLIDKKGVIRYVSTGYTDSSLEKLSIEIEKLLKE